MEQKSENLRFCRKCLTRELADGGETYQSLRAYIDNLDPDIKASEQLYRERLSACKECDLLLAGMCRSCGCYVELRAAMAKNRCPEKKWQADGK
ncbi:MAG: DUF6171 family protein [bacterium]|nr:DUF6171 family protein [bacterium]